MDAVRSKGQLPSVPALAIIAHMAGRLVHIHLDEERLDEEEVESLDLPSLCRLPDSRTFVITLPAAGAAVAYYRDAGGRLCRATAFCRWAAILHSFLALVVSGVAHRLAYLEAGPEGLSLAHCENIRFCPASHFFDILSTSPDDVPFLRHPFDKSRRRISRDRRGGREAQPSGRLPDGFLSVLRPRWSCRHDGPDELQGYNGALERAS